MAAQRLARGQRVVRAAAFASMPPARLRELLDEEAFRELAETQWEQLALPPEKWRRQRDDADHQTIKRTPADNIADPK